MTIQEFLNMQEFSDIIVLAGQENLNRQVSSVNIIDSDDIHMWLLGNELLLTNGFLFKDNPALLSQVIENLDSVGASGILIKLNRYIYDIPQEAFETAKRLGFPLLLAGRELKFRPVFGLFCGAGRSLSDFDEIYNSFSSLTAGQVDRQAVTDLLAAYGCTHVLYYDLDERTILASKGYHDSPPPYNSAAMKALCRVSCSARVEVGSQCHGVLLALGDPGKLEADGRFVMAFRHAVNVLRFSAQLQLSNQSIERLYCEEFLHMLLFHRQDVAPEEIVHKCRLHGIRPAHPLFILVIRYPDANNGEADATPLLCLVNRKLGGSVCGVAAQAAGDVALLLQPGGAPELSADAALAFARELHAFLCEQTGAMVSIGVGRRVEDPAQVSLSYSDALKALSLGACLGQQGVCAFSAMGAARLLDACAKLPEGKEFTKRTLEGLLEHDKAAPDKALLPTLMALADCDYNMKNTADTLFIHYNTLKYRYGKLCELLKLDLSKFRNRVQVYIALMLMRVEE